MTTYWVKRPWLPIIYDNGVSYSAATEAITRTFEDSGQQELKSMQNKGVIRPSCSPWASPMVLIRKKDGNSVAERNA